MTSAAAHAAWRECRSVVAMDIWATVAEERRSVLETFEGRPAVRWVATDHEWAHGTGDEVQGTMADLALAASGRGARVDALTGSGLPALVAWLRR
jgi:hypothetical protein